jgi:hypothetical protein
MKRTKQAATLDATAAIRIPEIDQFHQDIIA